MLRFFGSVPKRLSQTVHKFKITLRLLCCALHLKWSRDTVLRDQDEMRLWSIETEIRHETLHSCFGLSQGLESESEIGVACFTLESESK